MSRENKHINYTAADIQQYLSGKLSPLQMHAMEKAALDDSFLAEAIQGYEAMGDKDWSRQLVALREEISGKGSVAKVIPLHKSKNNWRKIAAAIFIIGAGTMLTFILTKNKPAEKNQPEVAQTVTAIKDTLPQTNNESPASVTASLNPTASSATTGVNTVNGPVAQTTTNNLQADKYAPDPNAPQLKPVQNGTATVSHDDKIVAAAPSANNISTPDGNIKAAEQSEEAKSKTASKVNETEVLSRQRSQGNAIVKKEAVPDNFFTAQVVGTDNTPLPFTNISIKKENFGTYADARGMVRLVSTDSILNVEVRSVGYLPKTFTLRNNQAQTKIVLQEDETGFKDRTVIGNASTTANQKSRRATLLTDSAVNVEPADGWENYNTYVANNLDIPDDILKRNFHGEVEISFDVKSNGTISNIRINKSLGADYDEAARRLIMDGPQWKVKKGRKTSARVKVQF